MSSHTNLKQACPAGRDWSLEQLPGLSQQLRSQLHACGITTTRQLLEQTQRPGATQALANRLQVQRREINKWVAMADLARVPDVGCQYCGLLLHAGIASVAQLGQTPAPRLHQQILRLQVATMQRRDLCPSVDVVQRWVQQAHTINFAGAGRAITLGRSQ